VVGQGARKRHVFRGRGRSEDRTSELPVALVAACLELGVQAAAARLLAIGRRVHDVGIAGTPLWLIDRRVPGRLAEGTSASEASLEIAPPKRQDRSAQYHCHVAD
jgi:hypothetical protein